MKIFKLCINIDSEIFYEYYQTLKKAEESIKEKKKEDEEEFGNEFEITHYNIEEIEVK